MSRHIYLARSNIPWFGWSHIFIANEFRKHLYVFIVKMENNKFIFLLLNSKWKWMRNGTNQSLWKYCSWTTIWFLLSMLNWTFCWWFLMLDVCIHSTLMISALDSYFIRKCHWMESAAGMHCRNRWHHPIYISSRKTMQRWFIHPI